MKLLLDTNRLSDALSAVPTALDALEAAEAIHVPVIVLGEIRAGFLRGRRVARNETRLQWFMSQSGVHAMGLDARVAHQYARIVAALRSRGTPIPTNDLWIAALAVEHSLILFTRDAHFAHVPGLVCC